MSDLVGQGAAAEWLAGASQPAPGAPHGRYRACSYPGCASVVLRGSQAIAAWREVVDGSGADQRRMLLCPEHAAGWDAWLDRRYREGGTDEPVLHH